jgi:hypothetical protein
MTTIQLHNGSEADTVASFNGGQSHFILDDHCYVLVNRTPVVQFEGGPPHLGDFYTPSHWIFPEALEVLKTLPPPT